MLQIMEFESSNLVQTIIYQIILFPDQMMRTFMLEEVVPRLTIEVSIIVSITLRFKEMVNLLY